MPSPTLARTHDWFRDYGPLISRILAALFGGYAVAALASVAVLALPADRTQAAISGTLLSFAVYAGAVIWVFAVRSARRAWAGLLVTALALAPAAWWTWGKGLGA
ncbi:iron uptake protein [Delftia sp. K82]|uniref:DUF3649 domain-containing protein n=1 Tax=Delftia sp. K82 TaxID=1472718 RepID=UPI000B48D135|nr:DUF3649 domain-containing protein [Delftia sp. K82]OWG13568.1 iron uptake protein [Delftia sp. K82]